MEIGISNEIGMGKYYFLIFEGRFTVETGVSI